MKKPFITIIIPTYKRNDLLKICLDSLSPEHNSLETNLYEVLVTDDGPLEENAKDLVDQHYKWAKWIKGPGKGLSANRNNGVTVAKGKWVIFIDDDVVADPDIITNYLNAAEINTHIKIYEGRIYTTSDYCPVTEIAPVKDKDKFYGIGCNFCVEKDLYIKVGGCDEEFVDYGDEDYDLFNRLVKHSQVKWLKDCSVMHPPRKRNRSLSFKQKSAYNRIRYLRKQKLIRTEIFKNIMFNEIIIMYSNLIVKLNLKLKIIIFIQNSRNLLYMFFFLPFWIKRKNDSQKKYM
jgi:GT2 family glycosyltransferase